MTKWNKDDVKRIVTNPIYVGMGPFPQIIEEELWITSAEMFIKKEGIESFLKSMIKSLRDSLNVSKEK